MKRRGKLDPQVAKIMRKVSGKGNAKRLEVSLTVGRRVVCTAFVTPKTAGEYSRLRANRDAQDNDLNAFTAKLENVEGGELCAQLFMDGKELTFGTAKFGRVIEHAILRIDGKHTDKVRTPEGLTAFLAQELA